MNTPLLFEKYIIRWIGTYKEPWFITKDIAKILGYKDTKKAVGDNIDTKYILTWKEFKKDKEIKIHSQTKLINKTGVLCLIPLNYVELFIFFSINKCQTINFLVFVLLLDQTDLNRPEILPQNL